MDVIKSLITIMETNISNIQSVLDAPFNSVRSFSVITGGTMAVFPPESEPANRPEKGNLITFSFDKVGTYTITDVGAGTTEGDLNVSFTPTISDHTLINQDVFRKKLYLGKQ